MAKLHTFFKTILYILAVILLILSLNNAKQSFKVSMKNKNLKIPVFAYSSKYIR